MSNQNEHKYTILINFFTKATDYKPVAFVK